MERRKRWNAEAEAQLYRRAAQCHGVLHRDEIRAAGMSEATLRRRGKRQWKQVLPNVFRLLPPPRTRFRQLLMAACLWGGENAVASHRSAAALHGHEPCSEDTPIVISISEFDVNKRRNTRMPFWLKVHRTNLLSPSDVLRVDGIPVLSPTHTLLHLASELEEDAVDSVMDTMLRQKQTSTEQLDRFIRDAAGRGRRGIRRLRKVVAERRGTPAKDSEAERLFLKNVIRDHGLPEPVHNKRIYVNGRYYKVDFSYPDHGVVIEIQSRRHHLGNKAVADARRQNDLVCAGHTPLVFWWEDIVATPGRSAALIQATCEAAERRVR